MNSEKVKEIKKALECCANPVYCEKECPYHIYERHLECINELAKDSLTLINELESENEWLVGKIKEKNSESADCLLKNQKLKDRIAELEKGNGELKQHITEVEKGIINIAKERNKKDELASKFIDSYNDSLKQFAENVLKFVKEYAFKDSKEIYTNGTILVPLFRVEYALETGGQDYQQG